MLDACLSSMKLRSVVQCCLLSPTLVDVMLISNKLINSIAYAIFKSLETSKHHIIIVHSIKPYLGFIIIVRMNYSLVELYRKITILTASALGIHFEHTQWMFLSQIFEKTKFQSAEITKFHICLPSDINS